MIGNLSFNRVLAVTFIVVALYVLLNAVVPYEILIVTLNGIFAGAMTAIVVAYWRLIWYAILGRRPYTDVKQMTLGFALAWIAFILSIFSSLYLRATGEYTPDGLWTVTASRYVAIVAAVLQVTAPDFGLGLFHGRDRKILWTGITLGAIVATLLIYFQANESFAG